MSRRIPQIGRKLLTSKGNIPRDKLNLCSTASQAETLTDSSVASSLGSIPPISSTNTTQFNMFNAAEIVNNAAVQVQDQLLDQLKKNDLVSNLMDELLKMNSVRIGNVHDVKEKLKKMAFGGSRKLLVISDFDFTLSRFENEQGERLSTTHGVFDDNVSRLNPELGKKFVDLRDKYYPIEFSPDLSVEEKIPHMEMWWGSSHRLIINERYSKSVIEDFVRQSRIVFKDGAEELIQSLDAHSVPLVIFSAGIGNIIEIFLQQKMGAVPKNTHFISNMILFDEEEKACAFSEPLIHTFCKNSSVIQKEAPFFHEISGRTNVILLGDSMGDIHMDMGVEKDGPTLKIGFYNGNLNDAQLLNHYIDVYDIVLLKDPTMTIAQKVIDVINMQCHFV